jgi:rubrerythrin
MDLEAAIRTALDYESQVHKTYMEALDQTTDVAGKRVFQTLADEEEGHLKYLRSRLDEWRETGAITVAKLDSTIPDEGAIAQGVQKLREKMEAPDSGKHDVELKLLDKALQAEVETSEFYKRMVRELDADGQRMFERFVEIEEGHRAVVQAEIDCLNGTGMWFDTMEFSLEAE